MLEYKILWADGISALMYSVNAAIAEGWRPRGGIAIAPKTGWFFQAMQKKDEIIHESARSNQD